MINVQPFFVGFVLCALTQVRCGGSVEGVSSGSSSGAGGAGSSSSSSGSGSGGGGGGVMEGTCPPDVKAAAYDEPPALGFKSPPGSPLTAVVVSVTDTSLEYNLGPGGPVELFMWRGPSLLDVFKAGDMVAVGTSEGWHYVAGQKVAAARKDYQFVPPEALPAVPMSKAPTLGFASQCSFPEGSGTCGQPPSSVHVLAVRVGAGTDAVDVPVGATTSFGGFEIHNEKSVALPGYGSNDCALEALFMSGVTALGPIGK